MQRDGVTPPEVLTDQPKLPVSLVMYLEAFYELDTERQIGMAVGRIPWSSIVRYASYHGMDVEECVFFIRRMDDALLERMAQERGSGGPQGTREVVQRPPRPN